MQGVDYIFCFQDKNYRFWQPDSTGKIVCTAQPYFIDFAPVEWEGIEITDVLNEKYWGADRSVTSNFTNVFDAAQILKHIFYTLGNEEEVYFTILSQELEYIPGVSYGYWYRQIFKGEVDLSEFSHDGPKVNIRCLEEGLVKYLKSNENTVFEFLMNVPEAIDVKMDGINLQNIKWFATAQENSNVSIGGTGPTGKTRYFPLSYIHTQVDGTNVNLNAQTISKSEFVGITYGSSDQWFLEAIADTTIKISITNFRLSYSALISGSQASHAVLSIIKSDSSTIDTLYSNFVTSGFIDTNIIINKTINVTLLAGEKLFLILELNVGKAALDSSTAIASFDVYENTHIYSYSNRFKTTYVKHFTGQYLFEQLIKKVTEGNLSARPLAAYFYTHRQKVFTCGNALRGLSDAVMKISWADFFKDWDCYDSVGIIESGNIVDFDTKQNLIDKVNIIQLPSPAHGSFKTSMAKRYLFNELEYGYPEIKNDVGVLNGNEAFCCKYLRSTGTSKSPAKLDKVSKIKADCYEQEWVRVITAEKDTTDNKADNNLYTNWIETTLQPASGDIPAHYNLDRSLNALVTAGLIEAPTIWNLHLSPGRNLKRMGAYLRSCGFRKWDNKILAYKSSDKNNKLVCDGLVEKDDVPISSLDAKFFDPVILKGDFPAPYDLLSQLAINKKQIYSWEVDGVTYYGIRLKVSTAPSSRKLQSMEFLSDSLNNLINLINYNG